MISAPCAVVSVLLIISILSRKDLEITFIARGNFKVEIESSGATELARRARGTPRIANRLLRRVRDYAEVLGDGRISGALAQKALDAMEVDRFGLDEVDRKLLLTIIEKFDGGPVGVGTIAASISEDRESIEEMIEPYLIQIGFLTELRAGAWQRRRLINILDLIRRLSSSRFRQLPVKW